MKRKIAIIISIIILSAVALLFIPVKFAVNYDTVTLNENQYFINFEVKTTEENHYYWVTDIDDEYVWVNLNNDSPQQKLRKSIISKSKIKYNDGFWYDENNYIITGDVVETASDGSVITIDVEKWDIVYPIRRNNSGEGISWLAKLLPNSYLTIYDFNIIELIKSAFEK